MPLSLPPDPNPSLFSWLYPVSVQRNLGGNSAASTLQHGASEERGVQGRHRCPHRRESLRAITAGQHADRPQPVLHVPPNVQVRMFQQLVSLFWLCFSMAQFDLCCSALSDP